MIPVLVPPKRDGSLVFKIEFNRGEDAQNHFIRYGRNPG